MFRRRLLLQQLLQLLWDLFDSASEPERPFRSARELWDDLRDNLIDWGLFPVPHDSAKRTPEECRLWLQAMLAGWVLMGGALLASSALITDLRFLGILVGVLVLAFPVAWRLHFSSLPRLYLNCASLMGALLLGYLIIYPTWPPGGGGVDLSERAVLYRTLVCLFYCIMAFRALAVRTVQDLELSALPAASGLLLILLVSTQPAAIAGAAATLLGILALLAGEHARKWPQQFDQVLPLTAVRGGRGWRPALNTWPWLSLAALVGGLAVALVVAQREAFNEALAWLHEALTETSGEDTSPITRDDTIFLGGSVPRPKTTECLPSTATSP